MSKLKTAIAQTGLVDANQMRELLRWGLPITLDDDPGPSPKTMEEAVDIIRDALESEEQVEIRDTDLDLGRKFLEQKQKGRLYIFNENDKTSFAIEFIKTDMGEYAIPWKSESIIDLLTNNRSYLKDGDKKVFFSNVRDLYYGETKVFMVCEPIPIEGEQQ